MKPMFNYQLLNREDNKHVMDIILDSIKCNSHCNIIQYHSCLPYKIVWCWWFIYVNSLKVRIKEINLHVTYICWFQITIVMITKNDFCSNYLVGHVKNNQSIKK